MPRLLLLFPLILFVVSPFFAQQSLAQNQLWSAEALDSRTRPTVKAEDAYGLKLDASVFEDLRTRRPERATMVLPLPSGDVVLRLRQFNVLSDAFEVAATGSDGYKTQPLSPRILTYEVEGDVSGTVVLFKDHVLGTFRMDGRRWELNRRVGALHALFPVDASRDERTFTCGVEDQADLPRHGHHNKSMGQRANALAQCIEVGIELDLYTYQSLGSDLDDAVDWALAILAAVDQIYRNELDDLVTLNARFVHVWMSEDPYASVVNDGGGLLGAFNSEWNSNPNFNAIPLDLKHLFTTRTNIGTGGIAYLNGLCNSYNAGVSGNLTTTTSYNINTYAWNLDVVAHEMGHNCGANHTHWCGWPGGPIDNCGSLEGDCGGYTNNPTGQLGTIMSYCHAIAGGSKNLIFHPLVEDNALIPTFNSASCIGSCGPLVTESTDLQCGDATACNYTAGDVGTAGCVYAGECAECGPDGNVVGGLELDNLTATLAGTGSQSYTFDADGTVSAINITLDFNNPQSGSSWPGDMLLVLCTPNGSCVQVGGYDVDAGFPSVGAWPSGWNTSAAGIYSASVSLDASAPSGAGTWTVQLINGWSSSGVVEYVADFQFPGLCTNDSDIPGCTDPSACNHDPLANLEDGSCLYDDALGVCGGDCSADANANGICDDAEACGESACGEGTHWDAAMGLCRSNLITCMGDLDFNGIVNVNDALAALGGFGDDCGAPDGQSSCPSQMCCNEAACGTGTIWDPSAQECIPTDNCPGDVDLDGIVTVSDILDVLSAFGDTCE